MSFFIAGATLAVGAYSAHEAGNAADDARNSSNAATQLSYENLEFAKEQYTDWKAIYGPVEQNLANFYNELTPDYFEAQGLQNQQQAYQQQQTELADYFAKNNIESGVQADIFAKTSMENVRQEAQIRADAPIKTAEAKSSFLSLGLGQKQNAVAGVQNASTSLAGTLTNTANQQANTANTGYQVAGNLFQQGVTQLVTANEGTPELVGS